MVHWCLLFLMLVVKLKGRLKKVDKPKWETTKQRADIPFIFFFRVKSDLPFPFLFLFFFFLCESHPTFGFRVYPFFPTLPFSFPLFFLYPTLPFSFPFFFFFTRVFQVGRPNLSFHDFDIFSFHNPRFEPWVVKKIRNIDVVSGPSSHPS